MVNEMHLKEKNIIFIHALVNMGFNKMKEEYCTNEEGKWFHWVYRYESGVKDEAGVTLLNPGVSVQLDQENDQLILGHGWKLMLQLKKAGKGEEKWFDYVYISQSSLAHAGLGLFTACEFQPQCLIGYYAGPIVLRRGRYRQYEYICDILDVDDDENTVYSMMVRAEEGEWVKIMPSGIRDPSLYMGMHYMNDIEQTFTGSTLHNKAMDNLVNVEVQEDGIVYAKKSIRKDAGLFNRYYLPMDPDKAAEEEEKKRVTYKRQVESRYKKAGKKGRKLDGNSKGASNSSTEEWYESSNECYKSVSTRCGNEKGFNTSSEEEVVLQMKSLSGWMKSLSGWMKSLSGQKRTDVFDSDDELEGGLEHTGEKVLKKACAKWAEKKNPLGSDAMGKKKSASEWDDERQAKGQKMGKRRG